MRTTSRLTLATAVLIHLGCQRGGAAGAQARAVPPLEPPSVPAAEPDDPRVACPPGSRQSHQANGYHIACMDEDGLPHGPYISLYPNGQVQEEGSYTHGQYSGIRRTWHENGKLEMEWQYKNNKISGRSLAWHANGQLSSETRWACGQEVGLTRWWDERGKLVRQERKADPPPGCSDDPNAMPARSTSK